MKSCYLLLLFSCLSFSQTITVDDTSYSATDLTNLLLNGSCIDPTNISYSSPQSVAQFESNGSAFPLTEGIILRTGIAKFTEGPYTDTNLSSQVNSSSDPTLETISANAGQTDPITDTAFLQFEFTPISSDFSFDFIFASNEYGAWQCGFSDVFAFLLTDINAGTTTNLAIVPSTTDPITVITIRDNAYNGSCTSENPSLFDVYNVDDPASSTLNMRGHTTVLNASSILTPGDPYRIRLVIGDYNNSNFDSAVFIDTGSFTTEIDLGDDATICDGNDISITTGLNDAEFTHLWTLDGNPIGGPGNTLTATQAGTYTVIAIKNSTACNISGSITISDLSIGDPDDLSECDNGSATYDYDLSFNDEILLGLDPAIYNVIYFATQADIPSTPISVTDVTSYESDGNNDTIYIKILNIATGVYCNAVLNFDLTVSAAAVATQPNDIDICESPNTTTVNLTVQDIQILNGLNAADFTITYYASQADLDNQNSLGGSINIPTGITSQEIWVLIVNNADPNCFDDTKSFNIIINPLPVVATLPNILECSEYTLIDIPDLDGDGIPDGVYYDGPYDPNDPDSTTQLNSGDLITDEDTIYILSGPDANGCFNESSFTITFIDEYAPELQNCGTFVIEEFLPGAFYTATGGPNGSGSILIPTGTLYTAVGTDLFITIHYYAETIDPNTGLLTVCRDEGFDITIYAPPPVDEPADVVTCIDYTLPALTDGIYYDAPGGTGNMLSVGGVITTSGTYYVYNSEEHDFLTDGEPDSILCESDWDFEIDIINEPVITPKCDSYTLPLLEVGNYFLEANGQGIIIPQETVITINQNGDTLTIATSPEITIEQTNSVDIYIYAETSTTPNCTENMVFTLTINPSPVVDIFEDVKHCINDLYIIDTSLINPGASYYVDDQTEDPPASTTTYSNGEVISETSTIYIYEEDPVTGCNDQSSFEVEILELPPIENFTDEYVCDLYILAPLTNGNYYSEPNGQGTMYEAGDEIGTEILPGTMANESIPIYIYNEREDLSSCTNETTFTINILGINLGVFEDDTVCDEYRLPDLAVGKYYRQVTGVGSLLTGVDEIFLADYDFSYTTDPTEYTTDNAVTNTHTFYVYAHNQVPERFPKICPTAESFTITIVKTPELPDFMPIAVCGEYQLPTLDNSTYDVNYYTAPGGNAVDLIDPNTPRTIPEGENSPYTETIYVHATATGNTACFDSNSFTITIHERPDFSVSDAVICVDPIDGTLIGTVTLESNLNPDDFTVNWYLNNVLVHTGVNYETNQSGEYTVETVIIATETPPNCNYNSTTVEVLVSSTAIATYSITDDFEDTATVTLTLTNGEGTYQYQLDDGPFQDSNVFHDVVSGDHVVTILDIYGDCGIYELPIFVLKYPKFFTPNGDGINDTWNIVNLFNQPDAKINVFDRFGKFIVQIAPSGNGWDGTYNNSQLPSTDYWFVIYYKGRESEGYPNKEFKAHFSLKR
ncbi:MAG: hypothetical protein COA88_07150 [Kordia sp.]|nr:MAG: hypothetical protein COA88_07150 [Kordia sp.]